MTRRTEAQVVETGACRRRAFEGCSRQPRRAPSNVPTVTPGRPIEPAPRSA